jgi:hypothetical protein
MEGMCEKKEKETCQVTLLAGWEKPDGFLEKTENARKIERDRERQRRGTEGMGWRE